MRKSFGAKPLVYPEMAFVIGTYDEDGTANAMVAAWGGLSDEKEITICVDGGHLTADNLLKRKAFSVSLGGKNVLKAIDYLGVVSGRKSHDKVKEAGLHIERCPNVDAPSFLELPYVMECRVKRYDKSSCRLVGAIVDVAVDDSVLSPDGTIDPAKWSPLLYDPFSHSYLELMGPVGKAFQKPAKAK